GVGPGSRRPSWASLSISREVALRIRFRASAGPALRLFHQRFDVRGGSGRQSTQLIAALQDRDDTPPGMLPRNPHYGASQIRKICIGEPEIAKQIADARIEA